MNLLKTDKVFFIGLATTAAVKQKKKIKQSIIKNIMIQSNIRNKQTKNKLQNNNLSKQVCITP